MKITEFLLKDVRCFNGEHSLRLRPLTFLVGENSTGKSTVLGCMQTMADEYERSWLRRERFLFDFNNPPYQMGAFKDIVRKSRPLRTAFALGMAFKHGKLAWEFRVTLSERKGGTEPLVTKQECIFPKGKVVIEASDTATTDKSEEINVTEQQSKEGTVFYVKHIQSLPMDMDSLFFTLDMKESLSTSEKNLRRFLNKHVRGTRRFRSVGMTSIAPLRSEPRRTYDPVAEVPGPSGADMPMRLMNLSRNDKNAWESLYQKLTDFGQQAGLFDDLKVKTFGKAGSNPFQLHVEAHGPKVNLIDTGYGISQILPILIEVITSTRMLLVQQPEVHLHPRGQAELATLLVKRLDTSKEDKPLPGCVIETHSDYMINRARIEISHGHIAPEDVSLIYLEKLTGSKGVQAHNITFDKMGNMEKVPESYGQFFLKESDKLLGFDQGE